MNEDLQNKPKNFPLGFHSGHVMFPIARSNLYYNIWFPTIHNVSWSFAVDTTKSDETNKLIFKLYQNNQSDSFHTIVIEYGITVQNMEKDEYSMKVKGSYEFTGKNNDMIVEIPGFDKIIDWRQGFFDHKAETEKFKLRYNFIVKSTKLCDSVELVDLYNFDPTIHDVEVNVMGNPMCLSKKLIALQSPKLTAMIEVQNIETSDLPSNCYFDTFYDFLQLLHGVDLSLDGFLIEKLLKLAAHLEVPRVTEYCKQQMVIGCAGKTTNNIIKMAEEWSFWDVAPRMLREAHCLADLKKQNWDLDNLPEGVIEMITRRIFELKN